MPGPFCQRRPAAVLRVIEVSRMPEVSIRELRNHTGDVLGRADVDAVLDASL